MYFFESPLVQIGPVAPVHPAEPVMSISDKAPVNPVEEEPKGLIEILILIVILFSPLQIYNKSLTVRTYSRRKSARIGTRRAYSRRSSC